MVRPFRSIRRLFLGLLLCLGLGGPRLRAQLDPKLQPANSTDFLDLYQQSTTLKVKPEVVTVFDFSGSMASLMFHPLYVNNDNQDGDAYRQMSFALSSGSTYTIKAQATGSSNAYAQVTINIGSGTSSASLTNNSSSYTISNITVTPAGPYAAGQSLTFSASVTTTKSTHGITWSWVGTSGGTLTTSSPTGSNPYVTTASCTLPATASSPTVNAALDPRSPATVGDGTAVTGATYLTSQLGSGQLVKPNGALVTASDAAAASTTSGFYGASAGAGDVRNWVRAASHVRFTATVGSDTRTVDIPIPWKVTNASSTGNPLTSVTYPDQETKNNADGTTTLYGSGNNIEVDTTYALSSGSVVLSGSSSTQTSTTLDPNSADQAVEYRPAYISWLFNGKYTSGTYAGKYVVYDSSTTTALLAGGQGSKAWGQGYGTFNPGDTIYVPQFNLNNTYAGSDVLESASINVVPALTRCQAVKSAAIQTWIKFQADVFWAFRFLDVTNEPGKSTIDNNSANYFNNNGYGGDSGWTLLNNTSAQGITSSSGNSVTGMARIASLKPGNGTPLTYAVSRALAQFTDPNSVFNVVETGNDAPSQCMNHFLILFTDGLDNNNTSTVNGNDDCPYLPLGTTTGSADAGNQSLIKNQSKINVTVGSRGAITYGSWWNLFTFAGIAAHLADPSLGAQGTDYMVAPTYPSSGSPSAYLPYAITGRNGTSFKTNHRVSTMTVGVSLGGLYNDATSPKNHLFTAAAVGDVTFNTWNLSALQPFALANPNDATQGRKAGTINFFDATNPTLVTDALYNAFVEATSQANTNSVANPNIPYVGATLGNQVYLAKFLPPANGGPIWTGDLLMFDTKVVNYQTEILDTGGNVVSGTKNIDALHAQWSAATNLYGNRNWKARTLYTRIPGTATTPEPGLTVFSDVNNYPSSNSNAYATISPYVATKLTTDSAKQAVIQFAMGADTTGDMDTSTTPPRPANNRTTIMGDVIDATPATIEYNYNDWATTIASHSAFAGLPSSAPGYAYPNRFRLILVGTNQGWLHAFGELSTVVPTNDPTSTTSPQAQLPLVVGKMDELWSFMPTDFLANLDYITVPNNPHRFMVDGQPTIYFLDLPPATGGQGNGVVDQNSSLPGGAPERTLVILGLKKGGRSYYALDIHNPFQPVLKWSLVPDEMANFSFPASRIPTGGPSQAVVTNILKNWGYSTCTPAIGRIQFNGVMRDVVFLGGGYSTPQVEANYLTNGNPTPLGRSILALDVYTGEVLAAVDLTAKTISGSPSTIGPIGNSLVPFEYFLNSGMAQRAYFMDLYGGLWSWGSKKTDSTTGSVTYGYRIDSSDLTQWTSDGTSSGSAGVRKVYQDSNSRNVYTTDPAPFRVGYFPGQAKSSGLQAPTAVGIAMTSGNRDNPLDYNYTTATQPTNYRVTMVFDRQDSQSWGLDGNPGPDTGITDSQLLNATSFSESDTTAAPDAVTPGSATYYLAPTSGTPYFGYYINFPGVTGGFYPKGINAPSVVSGSLYYSYFLPTKGDPCSGGSGWTYSYRVCDDINPVLADTRSNASCTSGETLQWAGVASNFTSFGTTGTIQGGMNVPLGTTDTSVAGTLQLETVLGRSQSRHPKARVWRTVQ